MADVSEDLAGARERVVPEWSRERERSIQERVERALVRRRQRWAGLALAAAVLLVVGGVVSWSRSATRGSVATLGAAHEATPPAILELEDGSAVTATSADARVEPVEVAEHKVAIRLTSGSARFSVTPNPERVFRVRARGALVTVLGTVFTVGLEPGGVRVHVERGRVHVEWPAGERDLARGEEAVLGDAPASAPANGPAGAGASGLSAGGSALDLAARTAFPVKAAVDAAPPAAVGSPDRFARGGVTGAASWRALAQDGDYARSFVRMAADGPSAVRDEPGDLLLAADVARLGGHPEKAVALLERVVSGHAQDSRAPLAAFTLGRTLLDQLGRPREAAQGFAASRRLDPRGALAEDALAREVESWSRAGEAATAHERAEEYVTKYPKGRRVAAVKRLGGVD
jgi:transmembrane sensor